MNWRIRCSLSTRAANWVPTAPSRVFTDSAN